ncbi:hypothetical protein [Nesterenkonia populi]
MEDEKRLTKTRLWTLRIVVMMLAVYVGISSGMQLLGHWAQPTGARSFVDLLPLWAMVIALLGMVLVERDHRRAARG